VERLAAALSEVTNSQERLDHLKSENLAAKERMERDTREHRHQVQKLK